MPEFPTGTLTLSILKSIHTAISFNIFQKLYSVATPAHLECLQLKKSCSRCCTTPDLQRVSICSVIALHYHSYITELKLSLRYMKTSYLSSKSLLICREPLTALKRAVACKLMQDRPCGSSVPRIEASDDLGGNITHVPYQCRKLTYVITGPKAIERCCLIICLKFEARDLNSKDGKQM